MLNPAQRANHVVVVGGGFSGTMQAVNLLRHDVSLVTLIEQTPRLARGVAYSTGWKEHLLNVRRANMSAFPDDPGHFDSWLEANHPEIEGAFVPRGVYGNYLEDQLTAAVASMPDRLNILRASAVSLDATANDLVLGLTDGSSITADRVVLALGNLPPHPLRGLDPEQFDSDLYVADPWQADLAAGLSDQDEILIVGSGLTMVDAVLTLTSQGFGGKIRVLSRRGLTPHVHDPAVDSPHIFPERPGGPLSDLVARIRQACDDHGWRVVIDGLRPYTRDMWLAASEAEQSAFLRHLRPWWDIHRHRIAPQVADKIAALVEKGRLTISAGKTLAFRAAEHGIAVTWRPRGGDRSRDALFRRIINCTGPQGDVLKSRNPLLRDLIAKGRIRPDPHHMGIDVSPQCEVIDRQGKADQRILALGPMTRGTFWEVIAVPDIRMQTWNVARRIANAHWVGGEGL
jgi:uncharacterized NAD(P)/FAD-binding protein YdhS